MNCKKYEQLESDNRRLKAALAQAQAAIDAHRKAATLAHASARQAFAISSWGGARRRDRRDQEDT
jgi:hypothetical protein